MRALLLTAIALCTTTAFCQQSAPDTDHDGLNDALEQRLLQQFLPAFHIGLHDCSALPAEFLPGVPTPTVESEDGTVYGQVFLTKSSTHEHPVAEIHYYHLWRTDCGAHGHPLDTEHVATLVHADSSDLDTARWQSNYWFAAAHENTVCDVSQIARASTLHAEEHGAAVWISPGKHASYLNETLCRAGCGNDRCNDMTPLHVTHLINLGEQGAPMNGSVFIASHQWPLEAKMSSSNFPAEPLDRLNRLPNTDIAWYHSGRHPAQGVIAISSHTQQHIANAGTHTTTALDTAGANTDSTISVAKENTGNALAKSYRKTTHALGSAARHTGDALHVTEKKTPPESKPE